MPRRSFQRNIEPRGCLTELQSGEEISRPSIPVICERIRYYRILAGIEQKELARRLHITGNSVSNWESGRSRPDVNLLPAICDILEISLYELYSLPDRSGCTSGEQELIRRVRRLGAANRKLIDNIINDMILLQEAESVPDLLILPCFVKPLAAGIGDPTEFEGLSEPMYLYDSDEYRRADYIFRINGDSMEPRFSDGDLVLVERVPSGDRLSFGEIGAFIVGNEMYIKVYESDGLHSLNEKYDVLKFDSEQSVYLIGRVLMVLDPECIASQSDIEKFRMLHE